MKGGFHAQDARRSGSGCKSPLDGGAALLLSLREEDFRPYMEQPHFWDCLHAEQHRRNRQEKLLKLREIKNKRR